MEIDFLGLNSPRYPTEEQASSDAFTETASGEVETSLSLSTSSSLDCNFCEMKKTWEFPSDKMIPSCSGSLAHYSLENAAARAEQPSLVLAPRPVFHPSPTATGFLYDLNKNSTNLRNISELQAEPTSLSILYSGCANVFNDNLQEKADSTMYVARSASTGLSDDARICTRGHTPTVAMARRATLARFLEKRLHRMNQARANHLMGKSLNASNSEAGNANLTWCNKGRHNSLIRS